MNDWVKIGGFVVTVLIAVGSALAYGFANFAEKDEIVRIEQVATTHVPAAEYEKHLENEERQFVLELKKQIRELRRRAQSGDQYAADDLADAINTLCELRPADKLCR